MMKRFTMKNALLILVLGIILTGVVTARGRVPAVLAQDPTIPTRTPTPNPNQPPPGQQPPGEQPPGEQPPGQQPPGEQPPGQPPPDMGGGQLPAGTPPPGQIINPPPAGVPTQITDDFITYQPGIDQSGQSPVAGTGCDETPHIQALSRIAVHAGPGIDYPVVATLENGDVRLIIGRAEFAPWWQIQVRPRLVGWVLDDEVNEFGNLALVPIVEPPLLNGVAPTPGVPWNPTPSPIICLEVLTPVPPATATTESALGVVAEVPAAGSGESTQSGSTPVPISSGEIFADSIETGSSLPAGLGVTERSMRASRSATTTSDPLNLVLPLAGILLIGAGILVALLTRNRGDASTTDPKSVNK